MNLLDVLQFVEKGNKDVTESKKRYATITLDDFHAFRKLLSIQPTFLEGLSATDSYQEYFEAFELLNRTVDKDLREDLFYAAKLGFFYEGIPSKLTFLLHSALRAYDTPNNAVNAIDSRLLNKYYALKILPEGITIKVIMENLLGKSFDILTKYRRKIVFNNCCEIYVENVDRVAIVKKEVGDLIHSQEDLQSITYDKVLGVCVQGIPVRRLNGMTGVTLDDFDLRNCE